MTAACKALISAAHNFHVVHGTNLPNTLFDLLSLTGNLLMYFSSKRTAKIYEQQLRSFTGISCLVVCMFQCI